MQLMVALDPPVLRFREGDAGAAAKFPGGGAKGCGR
jgi:hypothetical protein